MDTTALKHAVNLVEVAQQYTPLKQISRTGEYAGPCPCCGGHDRFHVKGERFYCRHCYPRGGDVIDLVMRVEGVTFQEACRLLTGDASSFSERPIPTGPPTKRTPEQHSQTWRDAAFQRSARNTITATHRLLLSRQGIAGQQYLAARGLTEATWRTYRLGFGTTFHPALRRPLAALFLPWFTPDQTALYAIQHRFLDPTVKKGERYTLKPGSAPLVFGLHALAPAETVVIVEGEFNGMALHQVGVQAVSVGSESNRAHAQTITMLAEQLAPYDRWVVWFDQPALGQQMAARLQEHMPVRKEISVVDSQGADANDWLVRGNLVTFLGTLPRA